MMPVWVRVLLTVLAGVWMSATVIWCGREMISFLAELLREDNQEDLQSDETQNEIHTNQ